MSKHSTKGCHLNPPLIHGIETTSDRLTGRAGLTFFSRYLRCIGIFPHLNRLFGSLRKNRKGQPVVEVFKQVFCFFLDGSSRHLVSFDALKSDPGYAGAVETGRDQLLSSHAVKRFFCSFWPYRIWLFRHLLHQLFLWRVHIEQPRVIVLGMDSMVLDNDEACFREGVSPTYKRIKGFHPLQVTWERFVIDAVFRGGRKHSNHSDTAEKTIRHLVRKIRSRYRPDVPIVFRIDSGFFDQKLMEVLEELQVGYIVAGKLYEDIRHYVSRLLPSAWQSHHNQHQQWQYVELGDRRGNWKRFRRALFCHPLYEDTQRLLEFARPDQILYTNLGCGTPLDEQFREAGLDHWLRADAVISGYHDRGRDELVHRALKDFASETLPFRRFLANAAFYYTMLVAFFLYECFKQDVCRSVVSVSCYATTLRRRVIDVAGKIVRHAGRILLKVAKSAWEQIHMEDLWYQSGAPPPFRWV